MITDYRTMTPTLIIFTFLLLFPTISQAIIQNSRHKYNLKVERDLWKKGYKYVIGSDESGRGSIAGPVVTASVCIIHDEKAQQQGKTFEPIAKVQDSKKLTSTERLEIYDIVKNNPDIYAFQVAHKTNEEIDEIGNINNTTMECFKDSIQALISGETEGSAEEGVYYCIVDGKKSPKLDYEYRGIVPCRPFVKADSSVYSCALASIIAKCVHDEMMIEEHRMYPNYELEQNMGYSSPGHLEAIHKYGPSPFHRMSFKALKGR